MKSKQLIRTNTIIKENFPEIKKIYFKLHVERIYHVPKNIDSGDQHQDLV